jgi:hypothetical protein
MANISKVSRGQPLSISARDWNNIADLARDQVGDSTNPGSRRPTFIPMKAKNVDASDMGRGDCFGIEDVLFTESDNDREFLYTPTLKISQQAFSAVFDRICIAIEPIKAGKVGLVAVAGICIAEVDCTNPGRYAHLPTSAGANLVAGGFGSIHILHRPAGTGLKNCLVRFDRMSNVYCKTQSSIAAASSGTSPTSGTVDVYTWNGSAFSDSGVDITVYNLSVDGSVGASKFIQCKPIDEIFAIDWESCA